MFEQYKIDPWVQLFAKQRIAEREHRYEMLNCAYSVEKGIQQKRKEYLGSDLGLTMFVHKNGVPLENVVETLSGYLGNLTAHFLENEYNRPDLEDLCIGFFYYSLPLYAYDQVGGDSFDDLIQLTELFMADVETFTVVLKLDLPEEIVDEWMEFLTDNTYVPLNFPEAVTGAVAVFLGVLNDPTGNVA